MKKMAFFMFLFLLTTTLIFNSICFAGGCGKGEEVLTTEWQVAADQYFVNTLIISELSLINIVPKCPNVAIPCVIDVYLIFYNNAERPIFYGIIKELTERDITVINIVDVLVNVPQAIPGKGTIAILPLPTGITPEEAEAPLCCVLDGYLIQKTYNIKVNSLGISKTKLLCSGVCFPTTPSYPLCEFRGHVWREIPNN